MTLYASPSSSIELFIKERDKRAPSVLRIASHPSDPTCIFQDGSTNACVHCAGPIYLPADSLALLQVKYAVCWKTSSRVCGKAELEQGRSIVLCIVSWDLYRDMYCIVRKCIIAAISSTTKLFWC